MLWLFWAPEWKPFERGRIKFYLRSESKPSTSTAVRIMKLGVHYQFISSGEESTQK